MEYYMGVDIGTTAVKVVGFAENGDVLEQSSQNYEMMHPLPDRSEQDPDIIVNSIVSCINTVVEKLAPAIPLFVSFSAAMHSLIVVDKNGEPLTNCIIWADNRAVSVAENLRATGEWKQLYETGGVAIHAMSPFCKILWLKENEPAVFNNAHKFIGIKEYFFYKISGNFFSDKAVASATGMFNFNNGSWNDVALNYLDITNDKLPQLVDVNSIIPFDKNTSTAASMLLPANTKLIAGASDGASANFSIGNNYKNKLVVTIGTSSAIRIVTDKPFTDDVMRTFCYHAKEKEWICGGAGNNGAVVLDWLKNTMLEDGSDMERFLKLAESIEPGCHGLLFLPYILGERAPIWDARAKAVFFGLTVNHSKAHLIRAALEAVIYSMFSIGKALLERNDVTEIYATGGFSRNALWVQMLADVFNKKVILSGTSESSAWGAVTIGMEAMGKSTASIGEAKAIFEPDKDRHEIYSKQCERFERLTALLKNEFKLTEV